MCRYKADCWPCCGSTGRVRRVRLAIARGAQFALGAEPVFFAGEPPWQPRRLPVGVGQARDCFARWLGGNRAVWVAGVRSPVRQRTPVRVRRAGRECLWMCGMYGWRGSGTRCRRTTPVRFRNYAFLPCYGSVILPEGSASLIILADHCTIPHQNFLSIALPWCVFGPPYPSSV